MRQAVGEDCPGPAEPDSAACDGLDGSRLPSTRAMIGSAKSIRASRSAIGWRCLGS